MTNKLLIGLLIFFFVLIIGEVAYLMLSVNKSKGVVEVVSSIKKSEESADLCKSLFPSSMPDQALNEGNLLNLRVLKKGIVKSSILKYQIVGMIEKVEYLTKDNNSAIRFVLKADNGDKNTFQYPEKPYVTVKDVENEKIGLFSIKETDKVAIDVAYEMMNGTYISINMQIL